MPLRDVAAWQAGLNLAATTGRSLGGPVGGWLADTVGWRWSFAGQAPIFMVAALVGWALLPRGPPLTSKPDSGGDEDDQVPDTIGEHDITTRDIATTGSFSEIDFIGASLLSLTILSILLPVDLGGKSFAWTHPVILSLFAASLVFGGLFIATEARWATNPVFPLSLLQQRNVVASYAIMVCQCAAQLCLMFTVPIYFQVSQRVSNARAGAYLFPAVLGNAVGAVFAGVVVKRYTLPPAVISRMSNPSRTGRYKPVLLIGSLTSFFSNFLLFLTWHGDTTPWEALYIFPSGFGTGIAQTAVFASIQASIEKRQRAPALAGMYLMLQLGVIIGLAAASETVMETVQWSLDILLGGLGLDAATRHTVCVLFPAAVLQPVLTVVHA